MMLSPTHEMLIGLVDRVGFGVFERRIAMKLTEMMTARVTANAYVLVAVNLSLSYLEFSDRIILAIF